MNDFRPSRSRKSEVTKSPELAKDEAPQAVFREAEAVVGETEP